VKQYLYLSLITIFFVACENSPSPVETTSSDKLTETISTEEPILNDQPMNKENQEGSVEDIIKEFPDGILSFLSTKEKKCLNENATFDMLRQIELDLLGGRPFSQDAIEYFDKCNIPPPPLPGEGESNVQAFPEGNAPKNVEENAKLVDIKSLDQDGVSPHLEIVDNATLRLFYSSLSANGLAVDLCDYD